MREFTKALIYIGLLILYSLLLHLFVPEMAIPVGIKNQQPSPRLKYSSPLFVG
ncbi:hypothetical protein D3C76_1780030 [compost metagenome]